MAQLKEKGCVAPFQGAKRKPETKDSVCSMERLTESEENTALYRVVKQKPETKGSVSSMGRLKRKRSTAPNKGAKLRPDRQANAAENI